jgi:hypothetical protein
LSTGSRARDPPAHEEGKGGSLAALPRGALPQPTANRLFELFEDVRRHRLVTDNGSVQKRFYDDLTELQRNVLRLLGQSPPSYFSAGEKDRAVGCPANEIPGKSDHR